MILVYSHKTTNRLLYTLDVICNHILKIEYQLVDLVTFKNDSSHAKLNYSDVELKNSVQINPHRLLFNKGIKKQRIEVEWEEKLPYFFKTSENKTLKYDILSSTFFLVSRYEEYLPSPLDIHNRYQAENSLAYKNNFLEIPIVNHWAQKLKEVILNKFPFTKFPSQQFIHIDTFDIDIAYAYKGKSKLRLILSTLKSILKFDKKEIKNRTQYFIKKHKDPFDVYNNLSSNKLFFFLVGNYGKLDKNLSHKSSVLKNLINSLNENNELGIHPSYESNKNIKILNKEKNRLELITNEMILKSRNHFLKISLPETYENLISIGIEEDYTMGYASQVGFRAGICTSYPFFNLNQDKKRNLMIYPFQIMDGTLNEYLKLKPEEAIEKTQKIITEIKKVNGTFISLWHNSSLSEKHKWKGWSTVYYQLIELTRK